MKCYRWLHNFVFRILFSLKPSVLTAPGKCLWSSGLSFLSEQVQLATPVPLNSTGRCREREVLKPPTVYYLTSLCLCSLTCEMGVVMVPALGGCLWRLNEFAQRQHQEPGLALQERVPNVGGGAVWDGTRPGWGSRTAEFCSWRRPPVFSPLLAFVQCVFKPLWGKLSSFFPAPSPANLGSPVLCLCRILHLPCCWIGLFYCYCLLSWLSPFWFTSRTKAETISLLVTIVFPIPGTSLVQSMHFINICRWIKLKFNEA